MHRVLVTGGAGYVGSHVVRELLREGYAPQVLDDLSVGHAASIGAAPLERADFADPFALARLSREAIDFVVHLAASSEIGASMARPGAYYENNVVSSLRLLEWARNAGVRGIVFSSTAAVYGDPLETPIDEEHPLQPTNPYGETKLAFERALAWYRRAHGLSYVSLRYFNAAGAHPDGDIGEDHREESHLIPRLLRAAGHPGTPVPVFGDDYATRDGTCVRDYVHVVDLARAHVLALRRLEQVPCGDVYNLGNGQGFTVREVIDVVERIVGAPLATVAAPRRDGDPPALVASATRARVGLGWRPQHPSLEEIVGTAWAWHRDHPLGYGDAI